MGKKVIKRVTENMIGEEEDEPVKDEMEDSEDKAMEEVAKDFAEGERLIRLYRYPGDLGGRPKFLGGLAKEDFNEVFVMERFGGGRYFGRWRKRNGQYTRYSFDIEGEAKVFTAAQERANREDEESEVAYPYLGRSAQEQSGTQSLNMVDVLRMMSETRKEAREEMRTIVELMRPQAAPPNATEQVFGLVKELLPLISGGGGESGTGNALIDGFIKLKDPIMKALETAQIALSKPAPVAQPMQPAQPAPRVTAVGNPTRQGGVEGTPLPSEPQPEPTEGDMIAGMFKDSLPLFVKAAAQGKDTGIYCDLVLEQVPVFAYDRLRRWLLTPGCLDDLAKFAPIISADPQQREWWEALRKQIILAINEELDDAPTEVQSEPRFDSSTARPADSA